ncbi:3'-5' exonuclease [Ligilactobacillus ceti]|uniref:DNA polymerase III polC-type n=1 Tax=Ligilactobacillus ceti DSM 22408 TaxID=1122146 RepID=A0A0R2KKT2_9LACO|nr:3'-5' exonuclease [Ligilactobacillus ceti]KRN89999.1 exonuclease [Ligilactobacillus ceti DSM 22408]
MDFIALDFETASAKRHSACSLALTVIKDNQIVDSFYALINPQTPFSWYNIKVHGIHESDVALAPTFAEIWPHIQNLFTPNQLVVAHNAPFDYSVLKATLNYYNLELPHFQLLDTVKTSRFYHPDLPNHKLDTVSQALNIDLTQHHNALYDATACAGILLHQINQFGTADLPKFIKNV